MFDVTPEENEGAEEDEDENDEVGTLSDISSISISPNIIHQTFHITFVNLFLH